MPQFDKASVLEAVRKTLSATERANKSKLEYALSSCLDDLSLRLKSDSFLTDYQLTVDAGETEVTLTGDNYDLSSIFAIMVESGTTKRTLEWKDQKYFLRDIAIKTETGVPEYFTQLDSDSGSPTIKFDKTLEAQTTLTVYFFTDMNAENVSKLRVISPLVNGTLAYYFGIASTRGMPYYAAYEHLTKLMKGADKFNADPVSKFITNEDDLELMTTIQSMRLSRS